MDIIFLIDVTEYEVKYMSCYSIRKRSFDIADKAGDDHETRL